MQNNLLQEQVVYAGFPVRAAAFLLDVLLVNLFLLPVRFMFWVLGLIIGESILMTPLLFQYNIFHIICYLLTVVYFVLTTYITGQTLGKRVFEICVVSKEEGRPGLMDVIYRETVGRFLSSLLCIGYLLVLAEEEKKSLHDFLCDTRVIYRYRKVGEKTVEASLEKMDRVAEDKSDDDSEAAEGEDVAVEELAAEGEDVVVEELAAEGEEVIVEELAAEDEAAAVEEERPVKGEAVAGDDDDSETENIKTHQEDKILCQVES